MGWSITMRDSKGYKDLQGIARGVVPVSVLALLLEAFDRTRRDGRTVFTGLGHVGESVQHICRYIVFFFRCFGDTIIIREGERGLFDLACGIRWCRRREFRWICECFGD